jgi:hypothetical protein
LAHPLFRQAFKKLSNATLKSPEDFRIKHIVKAVDAFNKSMAQEFFKIRDTYGQEKGTKAPMGKSLELELPFNVILGEEEECRKAIEAMEGRKLEIPGPALKESHLIRLCDWTSSELIALEPITSQEDLESPVALVEASPPPASLHN